MKKETVKILVNVLRVFVSAVEKGNLTTLHAPEVHSTVCRHVGKRRESERNNIKGTVLACLTALKKHSILFSVQDSWTDDKLRQSKPVEVKNVFGLTDRAVDHLDRAKKRGETITHQQFLFDMLQQFDVLPRPETPTVTTPVALKAAVADIKADEGDTNLPEPNHNAARIAAEVANLHYATLFTPARLLGALLEAKAFEPNAAIVSEDIGWEPHMVQNCRDDLMCRGLIAWQRISTVRFKTRASTTKYTGVYLTPLGKAVAEAGGFVDDIPDEKRHYKTPQKAGTMLKNSKRPDTEITPTETTPPSSDIAALLAKMQEMQTTISALSNIVQAQSRGEQVPTADLAAANEATQAPVVAAEPKTLGDYRTIAVIVSAVVNALCPTVKMLQTLDGAEEINLPGLIYAVTEVEHVLRGFKNYVKNCFLTNTLIDVRHLQDYAAQVELDLENIEQRQEISVLRDITEDVGPTCVLRSRRAIKKVVWAP